MRPARRVGEKSVPLLDCAGAREEISGESCTRLARRVGEDEASLLDSESASCLIAKGPQTDAIGTLRKGLSEPSQGNHKCAEQI